jgi:Lon protease-like protein
MIVPLFPLNAVLFPGGRLPLRIFEPRYMDMARACLRQGSPFGLCLIAAGQEVGKPARAHGTGTLAYLGECDMAQLGILEVTVTGGERFRILRQWSEPNGLVCGEIHLCEDAQGIAVPAPYAVLVTLLRAIIDERGEVANAPALPHRYDDAAWVGMRFAELLPIPVAAKLTLLEVDDAVDRLEIIHRFLAARSLLPVSEES